MQVIKERLKIDDELRKKVDNLLSFAGIRGEIKEGSIRHLKGTNIAYIEPHRLIVNNETYLIFGHKKIIYISEKTLNKTLTMKELQEKLNYKK